MVFSYERVEPGLPGLVVDVVPEAQLPEEASRYCRSWAGEKVDGFPGISHIGNGKARVLLLTVGAFFMGRGNGRRRRNVLRRSGNDIFTARL